MIDRSKATDFFVSLVAGTISTLGLQMLLILPIYLVDTIFLDYGIWPSMTLWKAVLILIFGVVLAVIGVEIYDNVENPFDQQMMGDTE